MRYGGTEKGVSIATPPSATVSSPIDGWVVYAGPYRTYGQLLILNAGGGYYMVLAGMERIKCRSASSFWLESRSPQWATGRRERRRRPLLAPRNLFSISN